MKLSILCWSGFVALAFAASRTSPPSGAIVVAKSGGQYTGLQAAVNSIGTSNTGNVVIFIQPGSYSGQVYIPNTIKAKITIYGYTTNDQDYSQNQVTLVNSLGADTAGSNDASGTLRAHTTNFNVYNINIQNSRGSGIQAIALSAQGNYQGYYGCKLLGYQDTVLVNEGTNVFDKCFIEGATDFIFGQRAIAWFEKCTISISANGFITANGRDSASNPSYYVINASTIQAKSGTSGVLTYLGRPWRAYSRTVFQNTVMSSVVRPAGWSEWSGVPTDNVYYAEYGNSGAGSTGTRVSWSKKLSSALTLSGIVGSTSWIDMNYWNGVSPTTTTAVTTTASTTTASKTTTTSSKTTTSSSSKTATTTSASKTATTTAATTSKTTTTAAATTGSGSGCQQALYGQASLILF
ncbi:Pectinesterase [Dactylellina cionopaga]|nr:Pectinesterase [Dactylellina cionopaga]